MKLILPATLTLVFGTAYVDAGEVKFDYLEVRGNTAVTMHKAKYSLRVDDSFKLLGDYHHQPVYNGVKFNVSMVAFSRGDTTIMMHAEMHTDGSGGLDYSRLSSERLDGIQFTSRQECATSADIPDPYINPEVRFLRDKEKHIDQEIHASMKVAKIE